MNFLYPFQTGRTFRMPVPSSYNDINADKSLRDFVGWVWYDREVFVDSGWANRRVVLRFDSAHYYARVVSPRNYLEQDDYTILTRSEEIS